MIRPKCCHLVDSLQGKTKECVLLFLFFTNSFTTHRTKKLFYRWEIYYLEIVN